MNFNSIIFWTLATDSFNYWLECSVSYSTVDKETKDEWKNEEQDEDVIAIQYF